MANDTGTVSSSLYEKNRCGPKVSTQPDGHHRHRADPVTLTGKDPSLSKASWFEGLHNIPPHSLGFGALDEGY